MARIVLIVPAFPKLSETFIVSQFLGLLDEGWDAHIICQRSDPAEWKHFPQLSSRADTRRRVHVSWPVSPRWKAVLMLPFVLIASAIGNPRGTAAYLGRGLGKYGLDVGRRFYIDAKVVSLSPDLVHFEFGAQAVRRTHLKELLGCNLVVSFRGHDLSFVGLDDPQYYAEVWDAADVVHCLGNDLWSKAVERGCPPAMRHWLIPPAIDATPTAVGRSGPVSSVGTPDRPLRVLTVARLYWTKGHEYALDAVRLAREQGIHIDYRIVGAGEQLDAIAFARHEMGLDAEVALLGPIEPSQVPDQLLWADVFMHPSVSEGFCNAVLEAQAAGLPVVCSDAEGLRENVVDEVTGFVVPRRNSRALAEKLVLLAQDGPMRQRMGDAGRARVTRDFRLADQARAFSAMYREVLRTASSEHEWLYSVPPDMQGA